MYWTLPLKVWEDQIKFEGHEKHYRFDSSLLGLSSYHEMILDSANRIVNNFSNEKIKALGEEMEKILKKRQISAERFGGGDIGHRKVISAWQQAVTIVKSGVIVKNKVWT